MSQLSLRVKSIVSVVGLVLVLSTLNAVTFSLLRRSMTELSEMIDVVVVANNLRSLAGKATEGLPADIEEYSLYPTDANREKVSATFARIEEHLVRLDRAPLEGSVRTQFELVRNMFRTASENFEEVNTTVRAKAPFSVVNSLVANVKESSALINDSIQEMISAQLKRDQITKEVLAKRADRSGLALFLGVIAASTTGFLLFYIYLMKRNILKPLRSMQDTMALIASDASDIKLRIAIDREDEIGVLAEYFNKMADTIQKYKEGLEDLVATRTQQLTSTQAMLIESGKLSALGEMAGGIAHEVNTPLAVIQLKSSQLLELVAEDPMDVKEVRSFAESIEATVSRISKIVKGLRSFSRNAANDPYETVGLRSVVEDTLSLCSEKFKLHGVDLRLIYHASEMSFECRATEISQVLLNLLNNSFDAIHVEKNSWIELQAFDRGSAVELWITDSGKGIPEEILQKIFQPFFTTKEIGKGTGLGLSISKGIIEAHGGSFKVDPHSANTRFIIRLPRVHAA